MWGFQRKYYWGRKERGQVEGIVVVFAWMSSEEKHLRNYVNLYSSLGWNSLVCQPQFLDLLSPARAASLALEIVNELVQELKISPCPVVFASFSGGPKACMYKIVQIIERKYGEQNNLDDYRLVRDCISGYIFDSSPVDFVSATGASFVLHQTVLKMPHPRRVTSWLASGISSGLDALFLNKLETQRAEFWQTLYSTVSMGAPYLIFCSEDDDIAPFQVICNFASRLKVLGADVKLVKWDTSSHVGHFRHHPEEYKASVAELLGKAAVIYSQRIRQLEGEKMAFEGTHDEISNPIGNLRKAAGTPSQSFQRVALNLNHQSSMSSSVGYHEDRDVCSLQNEHKEHHMPLSSPAEISFHGVLGQFLFDTCIPKDVEDWDVSPSNSSRRAQLSSGRRHYSFNPMKCILRSRL